MDFEPTSNQVALRNAARAAVDTEDGSVRNALRELAQGGIVAAALRGPSLKSDTVGYVMAVIEVAASRPSWALALAAHAAFCQTFMHGSAGSTQEEPWLPFIHGEKIGCTGHDRLAAVSTAGKTRLSGTVSAVPDGGNADNLIVFAETETDTRAFLLKMDNAAIRVEAPRVAALGASLRDILVENAIVDDSSSLIEMGAEPLLETARDLRRLGIAATAIGIAKAALDETVAYVKARNRGSGPTSHSQSVQFVLSDVATEVEAATLSLLRAAALRDAGEPYRVESSSAKVLATEVAVRATRSGARVRGAGAYTAEQEDAHAAALALDILDASGEEELLAVAAELIKEH